ncbi:MAG: TauD/TfdA family dioxygenase [bacterium]|nr:TauD/TfdA family dioxygenase [bacterium]
MTASTEPTLTETIIRTPIKSRGAWMGSDLARSDDWLVPLTDEHREELRAFAAQAKAQGLGLADIREDTFEFRSLKPITKFIESEIEDGLGLVVLRGLDLEGVSPEDAGLMYFAIGSAMGRPIRQNAQGHLLGHIQDTGRDIAKDPGVRGYQTRIALPFHTDTSTDLLCLLCYRKAMSGGKSSLASLLTIYNRILEEAPEIIDTLYERFHYDCREEKHPDGLPYYSRAAASVSGGKLSLRHNSGYAKSARRHEGCPPMTEEQIRVMGLIDRLSYDEQIRFDVQLEEGDMIFLNNYQVIHARNAFEDFEEPDRKRHLMRLWLHLHRGRPLAKDFDNRGGIVTTADERSDGLSA